MDHNVFNPDEQQRNTAGKIVAGLERISQVFKVLIWDQATIAGLSPIQIQILIFIGYHDQNLCTVSHLAREFNVTKATVSDAIRILKKKKLILKEHNSIDKRSYSILLSETGKEMVDRTGQFTQPIRQEIGKLTPEEMEGLWSTLSKLIYQLNQRGILTVQRTCYGCRYYDQGTNGADYCRLLEKELLSEDIRLDCPEFEVKK